MLKFPPNVDFGSLIMEINVSLVNTAVFGFSIQAVILTKTSTGRDKPSQVEVLLGTSPLRDNESLMNRKPNHL